MHVYTILYTKPLYFLLPLSRKRLMGYCWHPSQVHIKGQGDDLGGFFYLNKVIPTLNCCVLKKITTAGNWICDVCIKKQKRQLVSEGLRGASEWAVSVILSSKYSCFAAEPLLLCFQCLSWSTAGSWTFWCLTTSVRSPCLCSPLPKPKCQWVPAFP